MGASASLGNLPFANVLAPPWAGVTPIVAGVRDIEWDLNLGPLSIPHNSTKLATVNNGQVLQLDADYDYMVYGLQFVNGLVPADSAISPPGNARVRIRDGDGRMFTTDYCYMIDLNGQLPIPWPLRRGSTLSFDLLNVDGATDLNNLQIVLKGYKRAPCPGQEAVKSQYKPLRLMYSAAAKELMKGGTLRDAEFPFEFTGGSPIAAMLTYFGEESIGPTLTAVTPGAAGNLINLNMIQSGNNTPASIGVVGVAITIHVATDGGGAITSTNADMVALINGFPAAAALVTASTLTPGAGTAANGGIQFLSGGMNAAGAGLQILKAPLQVDNDADFIWRGIAGPLNETSDTQVGNVVLRFYDTNNLAIGSAPFTPPWMTTPAGGMLRECVLSNSYPANPMFPDIVIPRGGVVQVDIYFQGNQTVRFSLVGQKVYKGQVC